MQMINSRFCVANLCARVALDAVAAGVAAVFVAVVAAEPAYAYVDPSIMTYTIQALAGVAVALSAVLGVVWRRMRKTIYKRLGIDENAGKLVEAPVSRIDPKSWNGHQLLHEADVLVEEQMSLIGVGRPQNVRWIPRFILALLASLLGVYTLGVVAPLEIIATGYESLTFGIQSVWAPLVVFAAILTVVLACVLSCVRGRAFNIVLGGVVALGIGFYVQGTFMNAQLPVADGTTVNWFNYKTITCVTTLVWVLIVGVFLYLALRRAQLMKSCAVIACVVLIAIQSVGLVNMFAAPSDSSDGYTAFTGKPFATQEGLYEVSDKHNVIVFILDMFDNDYLDEVLQNNPDALRPFTGFTWYQNATGQMIPTRYSVASMLSGKHLTAEDEVFSNSLIRRWYRERNMLDAVKERGYQVQVYSTDVANGATALAEKADNFETAALSVSIPAAVSQLWKCALYRDMPWLLKWPFWFYTEDVNSAIVASAGGLSAPYFTNDVAFYERVKEGGLSVASFEEAASEGASFEVKSSGAFKYIHLNGAHFPSTMNERAQRVSEEQTDMIRQAEGSLLVVATYLENLRAVGKYDDATIIVTADHGRWYLADDIAQPTSPLLLVKTPETASQAAEPLKVSTVPTGHIDVSPTILAAVGADASEFGSGVPVYDVPAAARMRAYDATSVINGRDYVFIKEWIIDGDVQDWSAWHKTERTWPIVAD